jgi:predicted deacylase
MIEGDGGQTWGDVVIAGHRVAPGEARELRLEAGELYTADPLYVPMTVVRGERPGPTVALTAAVHGDELNGVAVIRDLLNDGDLTPERIAGTVVAIPVVNVPGFIRQSRLLPDRRDLNRSFPGSDGGSLTARLAHLLYTEVVQPADYLLDLHTAGGERSNHPQVRVDLGHAPSYALAKLFGCPLTIHGRGPAGSLRRAAAEAGVPAITYEAGAPRVFERRHIDDGLTGCRNVLLALGVIPGEPQEPPVRLTVKKTSWLRAQAGGMIDLQVGLGEPVTRGQTISINTNPFGRERSQLVAPWAGVVLGLSRLPLVHPGDAVCHLARLPRRDLTRWREHWQKAGPFRL